MDISKIVLLVASSLILGSCTFMEKIFGLSEDFATVKTGSQTTSSYKGGLCHLYSGAGVIINPAISVVNYENRYRYVTMSDNPSNVMLAGDQLYKTSDSGKSYVELTYDSSNYFGLLMGMGFLVTDSLENGDLLIIEIQTFTGDIGAVSPFFSETLFSGLNIQPGYTIGLMIDHATGEISLQDSLGNRHTLPAIPAFASTPLFLLTLGVPGPEQGHEINTKFNTGNDIYAMNPPADSQDLCGNAFGSDVTTRTEANPLECRLPLTTPLMSLLADGYDGRIPLDITVQSGMHTIQTALPSTMNLAARTLSSVDFTTQNKALAFNMIMPAFTAGENGTPGVAASASVQLYNAARTSSFGVTTTAMSDGTYSVQVNKDSQVWDLPPGTTSSRIAFHLSNNEVSLILDETDFDFSQNDRDGNPGMPSFSATVVYPTIEISERQGLPASEIGKMLGVQMLTEAERLRMFSRPAVDVCGKIIAPPM